MSNRAGRLRNRPAQAKLFFGRHSSILAHACIYVAQHTLACAFDVTMTQLTKGRERFIETE